MFEHILRKILEAVREGGYEITRPKFLIELAEDDLALVDAEAAILRGRIRRRFTDDPRGVRYELVGPATDGRAIAVVVRIKETGVPFLITVYERGEDAP